MRDQNDRNPNHADDAMKSPKASLMIFAFGLLILAYLVAIDRPSWFHIRPASGTAAAMSHAATDPVRNDGRGQAAQ